jgi:uncharacterized membrane-anchored protein
MKRNLAAVILLLVQLALVLSIAGKYLYERKTRPRVWVRTAQFDPNLPFRGRYLALQLAVDACGLPHDKAHLSPAYKIFNTQTIEPGTYKWTASLGVQDGRLVPKLQDNPMTHEEVQDLTQRENRSCERVPLNDPTELFIPDSAKPPFPQPGQELWVEVTVPKSGPPRPIQLALSDSSGFHLLHFE